MERLSDFLYALKAHPGHRWAFEFRHDSWLCEEIFRLLEEAKAALCVPIHPDMPCETRLTARWSYLRFHAGRHGVGFSKEELKDWGKRIDEFLQDGADVYAYFNNDTQGQALRDAESLSRILKA